MYQKMHDFYRYRGKSNKKKDSQNEPWHLLTWHSLDVAACVYTMVKENFYGLADILAELDSEGDEAANWIAWLMPIRHQSLRLVGMRNKVLLLDEVHANDSYKVRLLEGLLRFHAASGGSAIVLSTTLPAGLRIKLQTAFSEGAGFRYSPPTLDAGYPWLTHLSSAGLHEQQLATRSEVQRCVGINRLEACEDAQKIINDAISHGRSLCWVRNTVDDALSAFRALTRERTIPADHILLFHSRFIFQNRMEIEEKTLDWFGKASSAEKRKGKVLIATQVIEQSLDLDFDCMISDLTPVDLLIQRAGRLQRHIRDEHGNFKSVLPDERPRPVLHVLAPEWQEQAEPGGLGEELKETGYVYPDHARLWLTQALLRQYGQIRMPEDARALVDGVYEPTLSPPAGLETISDDVYATLLSHRAVATQNLFQRERGYDRESSDFFWDEGREFSTRLGERSVDVFLAWLDKQRQLQAVTNDSDFPWEKIRVQVRLSWWNKHIDSFRRPEPVQLDAFRQQQRRTDIQVVLVSEAGEADYYSQQQGLTGKRSLKRMRGGTLTDEF